VSPRNEYRLDGEAIPRASVRAFRAGAATGRAGQETQAPVTVCEHTDISAFPHHRPVITKSIWMFVIVEKHRSNETTFITRMPFLTVMQEAWSIKR